jgi:predicted nucleotidyltransferase
LIPSTEQIVETASAHFASREDILFAYLFGSHAKGFATHMSDIDIAVYSLAEKFDSDSKLTLLHALSTTLKTEKLDLVLLNTAPITLAFKVLEHHVMLIDRDPLKRHRFESLVMRMYFDFSYLERGILERRYAGG